MRLKCSNSIYAETTMPFDDNKKSPALNHYVTGNQECGFPKCYFYLDKYSIVRIFK